MAVKHRIFTIEEARNELSKVKEITSEYVEKVEGLRMELEQTPVPETKERIEQEAEALIRDWTREILRIGAEPKGLWLVDFDSGDGFYFCWHYGEDNIEYIHSYDGGFSSRRRITW